MYRLTGTSLALGETGEETESWQLDVRVAADAAAEPDYCLTCLISSGSTGPDGGGTRLSPDGGDASVPHAASPRHSNMAKAAKSMMTAQPHSIETMDIHLNYLPEPLGEGVYRLTGTVPQKPMPSL